MPRDLPVGNGRLLLNFDKSYNLRDIYWPHVGQEIHTAGDISHTGVWVDDQFAWLDAPEWQREMVYEKETLVTHVTLHHAGLQLQLIFRDCVDFYRAIFLRQIFVTNQADHPREVRLFFHYDWHILDTAQGNTVLYDPSEQALLAYRQQAYFLMNGQVGSGTNAHVGISSWATGVKEFNGSEGTWRDAEDGVLGRNPIAQGSVDLYKRSLLVLRTQIDYNGAIIAANDADVEHFSRDSYSYMWPRDGALVANALSHAGYSEITRMFYDFCNAVLTPDGYLLHKYNPDRSWGSSWHPWMDRDGNPQLAIQEDETALVLYSLWQHYRVFDDVEFVAPHYRTLVTPAADFLASYREPHTRLPGPSYDLWEERLGILTYTTSAVYAGLDAAANFSAIFGEEELATKYRTAADEIKQATRRYLWDEERGHFLRMITVDKNGTIHKDATLDSSLCGLFQFGMFQATDELIERTMQQLERTLWVKTQVGGMPRYENDYYYQVTHDLSQAQGNPWFICTLWLAQYKIACASTIEELHEALPLLEWALKHALPSGVMAEQVNPFTSEPLSVSPLTWSHAEFVLTVRWYIGKYHRFAPTG
ncbi:MAG: glycoside hydrolase family 15 protein [Chloroflexi bacterium]|nr:MAG: glycoside hydrolase family 15 protein [Chloroflexota bacterium]